MPGPFDAAEGVAGAQVVAVLGERVRCQAEVGECALELVELQEPLGGGVEPAGAHVVGLGAGVEAVGGVAVGVERRVDRGVALGQGGVGGAVGGVAVAGLDAAVGLVDQQRHVAVHVVAVGEGGRGGGGAGHGGVVEGDPVAVGVVVVGFGVGAGGGACVCLDFLGGQVGQALVGEGGGAVEVGGWVVFGFGGGAVERVV